MNRTDATAHTPELWAVGSDHDNPNSMEHEWVITGRNDHPSPVYAGDRLTIGYMLSAEDAERLTACVNLLQGISAKTILNAGVLQANLEMFLLDWDRWHGEEYVEDAFPEWLLDLAGGIDNLDVIRKPSEDNNDDE